MRSQLLVTGDFGNEALQTEAAQLLRRGNASSSAVPRDLAAVVGQLAVQGGDATALSAVTKQFQMVRHMGHNLSRPSCVFYAHKGQPCHGLTSGTATAGN